MIVDYIKYIKKNQINFLNIATKNPSLSFGGTLTYYGFSIPLCGHSGKRFIAYHYLWFIKNWLATSSFSSLYIEHVE